MLPARFKVVGSDNLHYVTYRALRFFPWLARLQTETENVPGTQ